MKLDHMNLLEFEEKLVNFILDAATERLHYQLTDDN